MIPCKDHRVTENCWPSEVRSIDYSLICVEKKRHLFALKQSNRCKRQQKTFCVMEGGSLTIFLCALFVFSAEGKVCKHIIVGSHYMLVCVDKGEFMA